MDLRQSHSDIVSPEDEVPGVAGGQIEVVESSSSSSSSSSSNSSPSSTKSGLLAVATTNRKSSLSQSAESTSTSTTPTTTTSSSLLSTSHDGINTNSEVHASPRSGIFTKGMTNIPLIHLSICSCFLLCSAISFIATHSHGKIVVSSPLTRPRHSVVGSKGMLFHSLVLLI